MDEDYGVEGVIYTDLGRDRTLNNINIEATAKLRQALTIPAFASGCLTAMADIEQLGAIRCEGIEGLVCARRIFTRALHFAQGQKRADEITPAG